MYMYIYIYTPIHIYIYIYICTQYICMYKSKKGCDYNFHDYEKSLSFGFMETIVTSSFPPKNGLIAL